MSETPSSLAPDPRLRKPKRALPAGSIDCHAHIFDRFEQYPLAGQRKYNPPLCTREAWFALHESLGIARGVQVHGSPYGFDNSITEDFVKQYPQRLRAVAAISPDITDAELKRLTEHGFRAARLMDQFATGATTKDLEAIAGKIAPFGWHIEINISKAADWVDLEPRLLKCPVPVVFDHLGRPRGSEGIASPGFKVVRRLLSEHDSFWTKVSSWYRLSDSGAPDYADMKPFVQAVLSDRPDRCVFGTNWPHPGIRNHMPNDADLVDQLESWLPNEDVRVPLFVTNAEQLYKF
jgi:predicted TIM-barrel fold metal-dependent hydrolase